MKIKTKEFYTEVNEVELTNQLIIQLVKDKKWGDEESLKELREMGGKWNTKTNSVVFPTEFL